jgi:serine/threonine-protein kinase
MIGTLLGNRYEVVEKIGEGGMALVYKAKDTLLNRFVAVKILKPEYTQDKAFVDKFKGEATSVASLNDNNIVNIFDVGSQNNINYIVMEYVNGKTLKQIIKDNHRLSSSDAVKISIQIARALDCAHRNNIIHRDIKPHNILVTNDGVVKVTDFGIAKASNSATITNSNKVIGSAHYFSPEQAKGSYVDFRTDIYSLGIVMYEMVTGKVPFDADSPVSVALKHIQEQIVEPKAIVNEIPDSLNKLILKALEKEPIKRYQSAREMLVDLQKINNNQDLNIEINNFDEDATRVLDASAINNAIGKKQKINLNQNIPEDDYDEDDYEEEEEPPKSPKKKKIVISAAVIILILIVGVVAGVLANNKFGGSSSSDAEVPKIIGLNKDEAKKQVESAKLNYVEVGTEKSSKPAGTVTRCYPSEGTKVKVNSDVRVYISSGETASTMPNLKDMDLASAKDIINSNGLKLGNVSYQYSDTVAKDNVISQTPDVDSPIDSSTVVDLVVSKGPEYKTTKVPNLKNATLDQAGNMLANANLKLGSTFSEDTTDKSLDGKIFEQSVDPDSEVKEGTAISVKYYKYKQPEPASSTTQPSGGNSGTTVGSSTGGSTNGGTNTSGTNTGNGTNTGTSTGTNTSGGTTNTQQK